VLHLAYVAAVDLPDAGRVDLGSAVVAGEVSSPHPRLRRRAAPGGERKRRHGSLVWRWEGLGVGRKKWPWWGEHRRRRRAPSGGEQRRGEGAAPGWELGGGGERHWEESDGVEGVRRQEGLGVGTGAGRWKRAVLGGERRRTGPTGGGGGVAAPGGIGHRDGAGRLGVETVVVGDVVADRGEPDGKNRKRGDRGTRWIGCVGWVGYGIPYSIPRVYI